MSTALMDYIDPSGSSHSRALINQTSWINKILQFTKLIIPIHRAHLMHNSPYLLYPYTHIFCGWPVTVVDPLLRSGLEPLLATPANFPEERSLPKLEFLITCVSAHAQAFGKDLITLQRLLDISVIPFFRVAETVNLMPPVSHGPQYGDYEKSLRNLRSQVMSDWAGCLRSSLTGSVVMVGGVERHVLEMPHSKRAEMMRGFSRAGIFKVVDPLDHLHSLEASHASLSS